MKLSRFLPVGSTAMFIASLLAVPTAAQLIPVRSVPVAAGDQFLIYPSHRLGMGGVTLALRDHLLDPFVNPARGADVRQTHFFGAPVFYSMSDDEGSGRTLPVGAQFAGNSWFGTVSVSLQQLLSERVSLGLVLRPELDARIWSDQPLSDRSATNAYAFGSVGKRITGTSVAIGVAISYADLQAVDGVDLLYARSQRIEQEGSVADFRVGLTADSPEGSSFEALLLHNRFSMTHDVTYQDWTLPPCERPGPCPAPWPELRDETNLDRTRTWGVHLNYQRPVGTEGWRVGGSFTSNWKSHPEIPNYEIMNIPRDPGDSWAYDFGLGIARETGPLSFGMDVVWEPIWSNTWAEAAEPVKRADGTVIPIGGRTVENDFFFHNAAVHMGLGRETERWGLQLGLQVRSYDYTLEQTDLVEGTFREQDESWMEWTPSWGGSLTFPEVSIRYTGRLTTGTGKPGVAWERLAAPADATRGNFIVAPDGPLTLQDVTVVMHQLMVSLPIH